MPTTGHDRTKNEKLRKECQITECPDKSSSLLQRIR